MKFKVVDPVDNAAYLVEVDVVEEKNRFRLFFPYNELLKDEVKAQFPAKWGMVEKTDPQKCWDVPKKPRTYFRFLALQWQGVGKDGKSISGTQDPYWRYRLPIEMLDCPPREWNGKTTAYYNHQPTAIGFAWTRRRCLLAYDPGLGKTLIAGRVMEEAKKRFGWKDEDFVYVCKNGALYEVELGFREWGIKVKPRFMSYETMKEVVAKWPSGKPAPRFVVFDESTQIKTPTSQRSEQALHLTDSMREEHGDDCFILCMTGTPAPKNPGDWWMQVEVVCPGFLKEGSRPIFESKLSASELKEKELGGIYKKRLGWLDDEKKCKVCCQLADAPVHSNEARLVGNGHPFLKSANEVLKVYSRLKGLVDIKRKEDCLDLPKKVYKVIRVKPTQMVLNAAKMIAKKARGAAQAMTLMRELSDGFQYVEQAVDKKVCTFCGGSGVMKFKFDPEAPEEPLDQRVILDPSKLMEAEKDCDTCNGSGEEDVTQRTVARMPCPKDEVVEDLLDEHLDVGRIAFYCGFTASVDRVAQVCLKKEWTVIRIDGRGWHGMAPPGRPNFPLQVVTQDGQVIQGGKAVYHAFRYNQKDFPQVAIVAQGSTAAHGLNFDVCTSIVNVSRDFNGESSMQLEERPLRGRIKETLEKFKRQHVTIYDIVHLETDMLVIKNHDNKRKLQAMTLGEVSAALERMEVLEG